ncbi:TetM/TetW/TetO/TetS family tetracycline resistance ribosomal protection protein [Kribbella sp. NBC_00709]|uniref:translation factor GTPase family protein n=1 Tax=Kribbella sp. NBC_00709 TaxID=2975972 RepID=UPI002E2A9C1E|nr:translation factor GTPase family protein [Kribbella sp. NBC_00709]
MGIVAHVDAGKTSLTERLLYAAGVIDRVGRVDDGNTQTDSMDLERKRGITIRSAVVSFQLGDLPVNLIDTPGHSDFIAEVERALSVLDGAVLVVSAVEGVQPQTRLLMRILDRLRIPTLLFVNKIDRMGARYDDLLADIRRLLTPSAVPMVAVTDLGTRSAGLTPLDTEPLAEMLAERNDEFLEGYLSGGPLDVAGELRRQVAAAQVHPVYFGSAMTGVGVPELIEGIQLWLPTATHSVADPLQARVFKVERGAAGQKIASARVLAGALAARTSVDVQPVDGPTYQVRPTGIEVFEQGSRHSVDRAEAGQIVALRGLKSIRIGDQLGVRTKQVGRLFAPPTLETVVSARDRVKLFQALTQLAEQDPLIRVRKADEITVSLYGEVQKEVIASLLATEYGVEVTFSETTPIHVERLDGSGEAVREITAPENLWAAGVGFRVSPVAEGIEYNLVVELGGLPRAFHTAIEETVRLTLQQGLFGWEIPNIRVDLIHTAYSSPVTVAADFRRLVPLVLMQAIAAAGTTVLEPVNHFELDAPSDTVSRVLAHIAEHRGVVSQTSLTESQAHLEGTIPAATTHPFETMLPTLTHGEGLLASTFHTYQPVPGPPPTRTRTDGNPLNEKQYVLNLNRSV